MDEKVNKEEDIYCLICASKTEFISVGQCDHYICSTCCLRIRTKKLEKSCPICKQHQEYVICYPARKLGQIRSFDSFQVLGLDTPTPSFDTDHFSGMMYYKCTQHYKYMLGLRSTICPFKKCFETFQSNEQLSKHLLEKHDKRVCPLCLIHRPIFIPEQTLYSSSQLKKHMTSPPMGSKRTVDSDAKEIGGHPMCRFCNEHYYDATELYKVCLLSIFYSYTIINIKSILIYACTHDV